MKGFHRMGCVAVALCLLCAVVGGYAEVNAGELYTPKKGQRGKDVVWEPTSQKLVDTMLDMAKVTSSDYLIDLGSGDGRTVIAAAKRGARALGIEYNPDLVEFARRTATREGVNDRAAFEQADIFESDFSQATVLTLFLLEKLNLRLRPKILDLKPGTRVVSNTFDMGDWTPDQTTRLDELDAEWNTAYFWIVPAKVNGSWNLDGGRINFFQEFQRITGTLTMGEKDTFLIGTLEGDTISFSAGGAKYTGTVSGNTISGRCTEGGSWKATR